MSRRRENLLDQANKISKHWFNNSYKFMAFHLPKDEMDHKDLLFQTNEAMNKRKLKQGRKYTNATDFQKSP